MKLNTKRDRMKAIKQILDAVHQFDEMMKIGDLVIEMAGDKPLGVVRKLVVDKNGKQKMVREN